MQRFLKIQDYWRMVKLTDELKDKLEKLRKLLGTRSWEVANLKMLYYIIMNIE